MWSVWLYVQLVRFLKLTAVRVDSSISAASCTVCVLLSVLNICATIARQADGHPHHLLEMWAPRAGQPVAPPPVTGAVPPHANGPRYPGTTPVATHALATGRGKGHGHSGAGPQRRGGMEIPPGNVGHPTSGHHLPGASQTPQRHAGGPRLPGETPMLPSTGLADGRVDHTPPADRVPAPICVPLSDTGP